MVLGVCQSLYEKTSTYPGCLRDLVDVWRQQVPHDKSFQDSSSCITSHLSTSILHSSKLRSFLSLFDWCAYKNLTRCQSFYLVRALNFDNFLCILSMMMLHHFHLFRELSFWKSLSQIISWAWNNRQNSFLKWLRFLLKVSLCSQGDTSRCRLPWARWGLLCGFSPRMTTLIAAICRQFWTSRLPKSVSQGFPCEALSHRCQSTLLCREYSFLWSAQFCFQVVSCGVCIHLWDLLFCQFLCKVCRTCQSCFWMALSEGTAKFSGFFFAWCATLHSRTSSLSFATLAFSTTASVDAIWGVSRRLPSAAFPLVVEQVTLNYGCPCQEVSLCQPTFICEVVCHRCSTQTGSSRDSWSKNNWSRMMEVLKSFSLSFLDDHKFFKEYRCHWLTWWDPWSSFEMLHWHWSASFCHLAFNSPFKKFWHPYKTGCLWHKRYIRDLSCELVPFSFWLVGVLFRHPSLFRTWSNMHEVPELELSEVSCIPFHALLKLRITSFRSTWENRNFVLGSRENNSMSVGFWGELLSSFSLRCPCGARDALSIFLWTWLLAKPSLVFPDIEQNLGKREFRPRACSTTCGRLDQLSHKLPFRKMCNGDSIWKRLPSALMTRSIPAKRSLLSSVSVNSWSLNCTKFTRSLRIQHDLNTFEE